MTKAFVSAVTTAAAVALVAGCSSAPSSPQAQPDGLPQGRAEVTVDGGNAGEVRDVVCTQTGWTWEITVGDERSQATAFVETGRAPLQAKAVRLRDVDGFSGSYWDGNHGKATARVDGQIWTISGSIEGFDVDPDSLSRSTRQFTIKANC